MSGKSQKRSCDVSSSSESRKYRKVITLEEKLDVVRMYENNERTCDIALATGLNESTLRTIRNNAEKIKSSCASVHPVGASRSSKTRPKIMQMMESMLVTWIDNQAKRNVSANMLAIKAKALSIFDELKKNFPNESWRNFTASSGWFSRFKNRHQLHYVKFVEEPTDSDTSIVERFPNVLERIVEEGGYIAKQVFNVGETGLFWKRMPRRTCIFREAQTSSDREVANDHVTVMLGSNAYGDYKLKPVVVNHSENPGILKGSHKHTLPVYWRYSKKGWISSPIFTEWFTDQLHRELQEYCKSINIDFKILLVLDNSPGHPPIVQTLSKHIKVVFLPLDVLSLILPMYQGIIATFKAFYLRRTFAKILEATDGENKPSVEEFWKSFNVKHAIEIIAEAWAEVPESCLNGSWEKLLPYLVHNFPVFEVVEEIQELRQQCVVLAKEIGFNELEEEDVVELLLDSPAEQVSKGDEELLQMHEPLDVKDLEIAEDKPLREPSKSVLARNLKKIEHALNELCENDYEVERCMKITSGVKSMLKPYYDLLKEKRQASKRLRHH